MSRPENYYVEFLEKLSENGEDIRSPEMLDFTVRYMKQIIRDARYWEPVKEYKYMITFTLDPKKVDLSDEVLKDHIEKYIVKLLSKPEVLKFYYTREHNSTNTHWHCVVHRTSAMRSDYLTYYKKHYGAVNVSRSRDLSDTHSEQYLSKESKIIKIL